MSAKGGGYCTTLNAAKNGIQTNFLTDAQFETVTKSPYDWSEVTELTTNIEGITSFQIDKSSASETDTTDWKYWTGYKAQPWPAAAYPPESYRFEKGDLAAGMIYNKGATGAAKWIDETMALKQAFSLSLALTTMGSFLAISMF